MRGRGPAHALNPSPPPLSRTGEGNSVTPAPSARRRSCRAPSLRSRARCARSRRRWRRHRDPAGLRTGRRPAAVNFVGKHELARLVVEFERDILAEIGERHLAPEARAELPHLVGPLLEIVVLGEAALERDRLVARLPGRLVRRRRVAASRCSTTSVVRLRPETFDTPAIYRPVPFQAKLEVLVRIERVGLTGNSAMVLISLPRPRT